MKRLKENKGMVLLLIILGAPVFLGLLALSLDMGHLYVVRNQLQNAVDAGAIAGASKLGYVFGGEGSSGEVKAEAIEYATKHLVTDRPLESGEITIAISDVDPPISPFGLVNYTGPAVQVCGSVDVSLFFGGVWGFLGGSSLSNSMVSTCAVAGLSPVGVTCNLRPWGIPFDNFEPAGFADPDEPSCSGDMIVIKNGSPWDPELEGWFSPIRFPGDTGGNTYKDNIVNGSPCDDPVEIGDPLDIEPGNMVGPTLQGLDDLTGGVLPYVVTVVIVDETPPNISVPVTVNRFVNFRICGYQETTKAGFPETPLSMIWGEFLEGGVTGGLPGGTGTEIFIPQLLQ